MDATSKPGGSPASGKAPTAGIHKTGASEIKLEPHLNIPREVHRRARLRRFAEIRVGEIGAGSAKDHRIECVEGFQSVLQFRPLMEADELVEAHVEHGLDGDPDVRETFRRRPQLARWPHAPSWLEVVGGALRAQRAVEIDVAVVEPQVETLAGDGRAAQ